MRKLLWNCINFLSVFLAQNYFEFFFLFFFFAKSQSSVVTKNSIKHEIDSTSISVMLASLVSSASNAQVILSIACRLYNVSAHMFA